MVNVPVLEQFSCFLGRYFAWVWRLRMERLLCLVSGMYGNAGVF